MNSTTTSNQSLAQALGMATPGTHTTNNATPAISPPIASGGNIIASSPPMSSSQIENDAEYARREIYDAITKGTSAIDLAASIAADTLHPRCLEVLGQLLKIQGENVEKLLKLQKDRKELSVVEAPVNSGNVTNNIDKAIVFTGTSDELVRMIRQEQKNIIEQ
jgi:hypothetical protein